MQDPHEKTLNPLVPSLFIKAVQDRLRSYSGTRLSKPRPCPDCGAQNYRKHNIEEQVFAVLITEDGFEEVTVEYRRYWSRLGNSLLRSLTGQRAVDSSIEQWFLMRF